MLLTRKILSINNDTGPAVCGVKVHVLGQTAQNEGHDAPAAEAAAGICWLAQRKAGVAVTVARAG